MASYKDIRRETGLSLATISKYFNGQTVLESNRVAIEASAARLKFRPNAIAQSLRRQRSATVGVLLPALTSEFHLSIIAGVETVLRDGGISLFVASSPTSEVQAVELLLRQRVDGIIAVPSSHDVAQLRSAADAVPVVVIDRRFPGLDSVGVFLDNELAGAMAARHLLDHGHHQVALLGGPKDISTMTERESGFRSELERSGLTLSAEDVKAVPLTIEAAHAAMRTFLQSPVRPTAVFTPNSDLTLGALIAINESGLRVGRDISLLGFDGRDLARASSPRLTIITQPTVLIAETAAALIRERLLMETHEEPDVRIVTPELLAGSSVARIND